MMYLFLVVSKISKYFYSNLHGDGSACRANEENVAASETINQKEGPYKGSYRLHYSKADDGMRQGQPG